MLNRHSIFLLLMAAAIIVPALRHNESWLSWWRGTNRLPQTVANSGQTNPFSFASYPRGQVDLGPNTIGQPLRLPATGSYNGSSVSIPTSTVPVAQPFLGSAGNPAAMPGTVLPPATITGMTPVTGPPIESVSPNGLNALALNGQNTVILSGDANGPNLAAVPMEFLPVADLGEIFRFDVSPDWVKQRWERISTNPGEFGLSGLRIPLVTGVNASDLQGSLTYYFDANKTAQKITFRGWTGNSAALLRLLSEKYGFKQQPTQWAGLFTSQNRSGPTGVIAMKHPNVISADNPSQQIALMLEINNPKGRFLLTEEMKSVVGVAAAKR